jgi:hypothetical protein
MRALILALVMLPTISMADIIPNDASMGDKYIKVTSEKKRGSFCGSKSNLYTMVRFQVCTIQKVEINPETNEKSIQDAACEDMVSGHERGLYNIYRLRETRKYIKMDSRVNLWVGIFGGGLTLGQAGKKHGSYRLLKDEVIKDKDITFYDSGKLSIEEEDKLRENPLNEVGYFNYTVERLQTALEQYNEKYPKVCEMEKLPEEEIATVEKVDKPKVECDRSVAQENAKPIK